MSPVSAPLAATELLATTLTMGAVTLRVRDLERMKDFYEFVIGLDTLQSSAKHVTLGFQSTPLIVLEQSDLNPAPENAAGLYHLAILFESQSDLAQAVRRVLENAPELFDGSADHGVSKAFYLNDPEGNGIELYYDREPSSWQWKNGLVAMGSEDLDPGEFIKQHADAKSHRHAMRMGHVHLKVGDLDEARSFYADTVGFTVTSYLPSALFVSVGGYHHHLGMNTWHSQGAGRRGETPGLRSFQILLPEKENVRALKERLDERGVTVKENAKGIMFEDPWGNEMSVE